MTLLGKNTTPVRAIVILFAVSVAVIATGRAAVPEFSGYFGIGKHYLFILTNVEAKESSGWLTFGQVFQGYAIDDFEAEKAVLVLRHAGQSIRVPLKADRVVAAPKKPTPRATSTGVDGGSELKMTMASDGVLSLKGHAFAGETLDALFAVMAREEEGLLLIIEQQYPKEADSTRDLELLKSITARMRAAGFKRGAVNMKHTRDDTSKE